MSGCISPAEALPETKRKAHEKKKGVWHAAAVGVEQRVSAEESGMGELSRSTELQRIQKQAGKLSSN